MRISCRGFGPPSFGMQTEGFALDPYPNCESVAIILIFSVQALLNHYYPQHPSYDAKTRDFPQRFVSRFRMPPPRRRRSCVVVLVLLLCVLPALALWEQHEGKHPDHAAEREARRAPDLPEILTLRRSRCSRVSCGMGDNASRPLVAPSNHVANAVPNASPHRSAPMFPTAAAHIVDMPRAAQRLMSIASPDSVSGWSCPSPGEAQNITRDAQNITFSQPCVMSSLYAPNTYIWYSKKRRKQ